MLSAPLPLQTESQSTEPNPTLQALEKTQQQTQEQVQQTSTSEGAGDKSSLADREDKGGQQQQEAPKRLLTDEDIAALKSAMPQPQQQQVQQKQLTQDEIDALLHVWKPDAKWYERVSAGGEEALKAFAEQRDGMNRQFARRMQLEIMQLRQELAPGMASAAAVAEQAEETKFYASNKDLDPHRDIVRFMYDNLSKAGKLQGMTAPQMYKAVADETRAYCKSKGIALASTPASAGVSKQTTRKVPAQLNGTNQGGGAGGQSADSVTVAALRRIG